MDSIARVKDLIALLQKCPQDDLVIAEINGQEESADIADVLVGSGTTRGFTYLKIEPYENS